MHRASMKIYGTADKGEWVPVPLYKRNPGPRRPSAMLMCPGCGEEGSLHDHSIAADGRVTPPIRCPFGCGYEESDFVLDGWSFGAVTAVPSPSSAAFKASTASA